MHDKLKQLRSALNTMFPERKEVIDGILCALLAAEHVLLIGMPGTAKSALARVIAQAFQGHYWEILITKFTTPEEIVGALSLKSLEQDRFERITKGKLPEAEIAFVDEVFKASSAILNTMLTLMNERVFHNGGIAVRCPLVTMVGASNELPEGKELEALLDRYLLRYSVDYLLRPSNLRQILTAPDPVPSVCMTMADLNRAQAEVAKVTVTDDTIEALINIRDGLKAEGIIASDRRWKKSLKVVQAAAFMAGEKATTPEDLAILVDSLWREPKERPKIARIVGKLADPVGSQATEILDAARETAGRVQALKTSDRKAYISQAAQAIEQFNAQQDKLSKLVRSAGRRGREVVSDASAEINTMHGDLARAVSAGLGLRNAR